MGHPQFRSRKLAPEAAASLAASRASSATLVAICTPACSGECYSRLGLALGDLKACLS